MSVIVRNSTALLCGAVVHIFFFFIFTLLFGSGTAHVHAEVTGVVTWKSDESPAGNTNGLSIPVLSADGKITGFAEVLPIQGVFLLRDTKGGIVSKITDNSLLDCTDPTGTSLINDGPAVMIFCGGKSSFLYVMLSGGMGSMRVVEVSTESTFYPSSSSSPTPLVRIRGSSPESRKDAVFAVSKQGKLDCIGQYAFEESVSLCDKDPIVDFYFPKWVPITSDESGPEGFIITERKSAEGLKIDSYYLPDFGYSAAPNASATLEFVGSNKAVHTNVNDISQSEPLIAYVQGTAAETLKLAVVVLDANSLVRKHSGSIDAGIAVSESTLVTGAYMVSTGRGALLMVQTSALLIAVNYTVLSEVNAPLWTAKASTTAGVLFLPFRAMENSFKEYYRRMLSPSFTDYNPYHIIKAKEVQFLESAKNVTKLGILDGSLKSSFDVPWTGASFCSEADRLAAITAFDESMVYLGCENSGRYCLVDPIASKPHYSITFPSMGQTEGGTFGYLLDDHSVVLCNGSRSAGLALHPLLLYSESVLIPQRDPPVGAYNRGRMSIVTTNVTNPGEMLFYFYVHDTAGDSGGRDPLPPSNGPVTLMKNASSAKPFTTFFGDGNNYVAVATTPGIVSIFSAANGEAVMDLLLAGCVPSGANPDSGVITFMKSVQHFGNKEDYYVLLGGTDACLFEVNDSLVARVTSLQGYQSGVVVGTTRYSGYKFVPATRTLQAFTSFFGPSSMPVYTEAGIDSYVVGSNVFVYVKDDEIICRSVRSDIIVWKYKFSEKFQGPVVHMTYYNNTVFVVSQREFFRFDVQHYEDEDRYSRLLFQNGLTEEDEKYLGAAVNQGIVFLFSGQKIYCHDAVNGKLIWKADPRIQYEAKDAKVEAVIYSSSDTGEVSTGDIGTAYIEVRMTVSQGNNKPRFTHVDVYAQASGELLKSVLDAPNDLTGPVIWGNKYVTFSTLTKGLVTFRALNISQVDIPEQAKRPEDPVTDVYVPGEKPIEPPPPPLPRGDNFMAASPPMKLSVAGRAALISTDRKRAVVGKVEHKNRMYEYKIRCFNVDDPQGNPIREWALPPAPVPVEAKFMEFNKDNFAIFLPSNVQFYSWSNCKEVGKSISLTGIVEGLPSYISLGYQNQWLFLNSDQVTSLEPSTGNEKWRRNVRGCITIRRVDNYIICDGGSNLVVLNAGSGVILFEDAIEGGVTTMGLDFAGVVRTPRGYDAAFYTTSGKVFQSSIAIPWSAGKVMGAIPGTLDKNVVVLFENLAASIMFDTSAKKASLLWTSDLNGERARPGAAAYAGARGVNIVIGTDNGIIMLNSSSGKGFVNISLPKRYEEDTDEVQVLKMVAVKENTLYGISWNGYAVLVRVAPGMGEALFAFGLGRVRASQLSFEDNFLVISGGGSAGTVPIDATYWGAPLSCVGMSFSASTNFMAGWDQTNDTAVNLVVVTAGRTWSSSHIPHERAILSSMSAANAVVFFGKRTISTIGGLEGIGMEFTIPRECEETKLKEVSVGGSTTGASLVWYTGEVRDCIFVLGAGGAPPSFLAGLSGKYAAVVNVRYGTSFGLFTSTHLSLLGYDGTRIDSIDVNNPIYVSSLSSPDTGDGIFLVVSADNQLICLQVNGLFHVWNYTLPSPSRAPATYYNEGVFISTEAGPYFFTLAEISYPCHDRAIFRVPRVPTEGRSNIHTKVVVNEEYAIGFVTTFETFYAFDALTGEVLWQRPDLFAVSHAAVLREGMLLVVSTKSSGVVFLNPFTGVSLLYFANTVEESSEIFLSPDGTTVGFGGVMATAINVNDYARYFDVVKANRPKQQTPPAFRPYNYGPTDNPNDCSEPSGDGEPIHVQLSPEWVSGSKYGPISPKQTTVAMSHGEKSGWAASLEKQKLYIARAVDGAFEETALFQLKESGCDLLNLYSLSAKKAYVGVRCGKKTHFYNASGVEQGILGRAAKNAICAVIKSNGYFVNTDGYFDAVNLNKIKPLPSSPSKARCKSKFDIVPANRLERLLFVCAGTGIRILNHATLAQIGSTITGGATRPDFTMYEADDNLRVGIACGKNGTNVYMVAFSLQTAETILMHNESVQGTPLCGIRYPDYPSRNDPLFVFAYPNGYRTWEVQGGKPKTTQEAANTYPAAITSHGVIYYNTGNDYYFRSYGFPTSSLIVSSKSPATGSMMIKGPDGVQVSPSVIIYGSAFTLAVDTSTVNPRIFWSGNGLITFAPEARFVSKLPFVYTTVGNSLVAFMLAGDSFALEEVLRINTAMIDQEQRVFLSQRGTIGCVDKDGKVLWNVGFSNSGTPQVLFAPIILDNLDFALVSGGVRVAAIINKRTGVVARSVQFERCIISPDSTEADVVVNGTIVFVAIRGWSCVHVVDLNLKNKSGKITGPEVKALEIENTPTGILGGYPMVAMVEFANHLVFALQPENGDMKRPTFVVYRVDDMSKSLWTQLWKKKLRADLGKISTYGYFLYTAADSVLNVYDLLTGRYVWGYIFEKSITGPVLGADRTLYVTTLDGIQSLRSTLSLSWSLRLMGNITLPKRMVTPSDVTIGPVRTPYGHIIISNSVGTLAVEHEREGSVSKLAWYTEKSISRFGVYDVNTKAKVGLFDASDGTGIMDLTSGKMLWLGGVYPADGKTNGVASPSFPFFVCFFVLYVPTCRLVPEKYLMPSRNLPLYKYDTEPTEKTPDEWDPIYPGGGGSIPLHPSPRCQSMMHAYIPPFTECINKALRLIYPRGRGTTLVCPASFYIIGICQDSLKELADACPDVGVLLVESWKAQTMDKLSPLGLCEAEEASARCQTKNDTVLNATCSVVSMSFVLNDYENPMGYELGYELPIFDFPSIRSAKSVGAILGGVMAILVVIAIGAAVGVHFYRKKKRVRDSRFFDDDVNASLLGSEGQDLPMQIINNESHKLMSGEGSLANTDAVSSRVQENPPPELENGFSPSQGETNGVTHTAAAPAAIAGPKKMPPKMPMKMPGKMPPGKGLGPKMPPPSRPVRKPVNENPILDDDL
ncbi:hypothetical protein ECC02_009349 [Trypanosoma cruzi]|uniref:Uncharacterized protein n=1 Tax=Trypanosoma cruzi TaxID=5693 RepID=A0A7J6XUD6_TRYCR|nr:hypothetical protein ECC02_009349 [Trypanosoma cruzi]